jgi:long-chain acyl-CoA synthetase
MLVRDLFEQQVNKTPDYTAVVFKEKETTWREIDYLSNRFANGLTALGIKKGDRVAAILTNSLEFIVAHFALMKNGGVFVPLNPQLTASHIEYTLNHSEATILLCDEVLVPVVQRVSPDLKHIEQIIMVGEGKAPEELLSFNDVLEKGGDGEPSIALSEEDTAIFLYTAGTTGDPKGVVHTHANCAFVATHWARVFRMGFGKSIFMALPLFHAFGIHCISLPALISGARLVMTDRYHTQEALEFVQKYRISVLPLVPAMGTLIINHEDLDQYDFSSLDIMLIGGAIVPFELIKKWREKFPALEIINGYGQTESCPCSTGLWDVDILEKPRSVGKPWDIVDLKILDDRRKALPPGEMGEIVYRVPSIMKGYYKAPELTAETVKDGWLYSGDLGYVDEDGYVYIVDRKKDIIIRGGENISSMEIEEAMHEHPAVLEASAISAPHDVLGETVMAVVVKKPGRDLEAEDLKQFCGERLERFKVPERVEFMDELPRNPGGKVLKRKLKEKYFGKNG